jgi:Sulfotransferase domain
MADMDKFTNNSPKIIVWNHHKCATAFMTKVLSHVAQLNGLRFAMSHRGDMDMVQSIATSDIIHVKNSHAGLTDFPSANGVHIVRNPYSVVVSAYYSHLKTHPVELKNESWVKLSNQRKRLETLDVDEGIAATIDFLLDPEFYPGTPGPLHAMANWQYDDDRFTTLRMEDLVQAPITRLSEAFKKCGIDLGEFNLPCDDGFTFETVSGGRRVGQVDERNHYRSGNPDDWKSRLSQHNAHNIKDSCRNVFDLFYAELE